MSDQYVLRERDGDEISRLRFQHEVWKEQTDFAIELANIQPDDNIVDLGSGPGYLGKELAQKREFEGNVYCLDNSDKFIDYMYHDKTNNLIPVNADIKTDLPGLQFNGQINKVFCRWVLMFLGEADNIIKDIYQLLSPGGKFVSMEYFNFGHIDLFPKSPYFSQIYDGVQQLLIKNGGDPNIGTHMYNIMRNAGFKNIKLHPIYRTGKSGSLLWQWLEKNNPNHINLVHNKIISNSDYEHFLKDWQEKTKLDYAFITSPPLMITVGEK